MFVLLNSLKKFLKIKETFLIKNALTCCSWLSSINFMGQTTIHFFITPNGVQKLQRTLSRFMLDTSDAWMRAVSNSLRLLNSLIQRSSFHDCPLSLLNCDVKVHAHNLGLNCPQLPKHFVSPCV